MGKYDISYEVTMSRLWAGLTERLTMQIFGEERSRQREEQAQRPWGRKGVCNVYRQQGVLCGRAEWMRRRLVGDEAREVIGATLYGAVGGVSLGQIMCFGFYFEWDEGNLWAVLIREVLWPNFVLKRTACCSMESGLKRSRVEAMRLVRSLTQCNSWMMTVMWSRMTVLK